MGMGSLWWRWLQFGLDSSGFWVANGWRFGWLCVTEFWWKVLCVFARESDKKVKRNERWKSIERN